MRISRIYYSGAIVKAATICLPIDTSHYIMHVLRLKMGSVLILFNGQGTEHTAKILAVTKKNVVVAIEDSQFNNVESPFTIHLAQAISRGEKMDWVMQKSVELGVSRIIPLITDHCGVRCKEERLLNRMSHWQKVIISACEQSGRNVLPRIEAIRPFRDWIPLAHPQCRFFCQPGASQSLSELSPTKGEVLVLVGPEGGFSHEEIALAKQYDFAAVSLGPRILRTETAAVVVIGILQHLWGDIA